MFGFGIPQPQHAKMLARGGGCDVVALRVVWRRVPVVVCMCVVARAAWRAWIVRVVAVDGVARSVLLLSVVLLLARSLLLLLLLLVVVVVLLLLLLVMIG